MNFAIAVGIVVAISSATALDPGQLLGSGGSEVLLLMVWGTTLLLAGRRVRGRSGIAATATSLPPASSAIRTTGTELQAGI
jgi:hypothetical protein